ncbi:uncharacterized protein LOC127279308 [Leptopilina boulardi]|uniref:uncharacterized protein LOC127279308 n=1 Tax=Leptopilina boulardi TaxID=63433 RepID=UPI0021F685A5|nr:uncharacterized protein LOC127279308 [Leptopilina boulardi]
MPDITDEDLIIEVQNMFSDTRDENRRKATVVPYNEEVPSKKCKSKEDQNLCRENEFVDVNNLSFDNQSESANNEISSLPVDLNSMSPTSSMNDSTIEQSNEEKNEILTLSKEHENKIVNESVEYKEQKSDKANEVDTFCERLAVSLRRLPPKTRSRVEINILKVLYEAEFGEKF